MQGRTALGLMVASIAILMAGYEDVSSVSPSTGQIFIAEACNHRIVRINDMTGAGWTTFGSGGGGVNQFREPYAIFVSRARQIFVADAGRNFRWQGPPENNRIVRVDDMTGSGWTTFGIRGSGINQFSSPSGIFVNAAGQIFVADPDNNRIVRINDMTGTGWTTFSGTGTNHFEGPTKVFVSQAGQIYVLDFGNRRIVRIDDMKGTGWTTFGTLGEGVNQFVQLTDIFVSPSGQIYATDFFKGVVRINDMTGTGWTGFVGGFDNGLGGIFVSSAGEIFVGEYNRITRMNDMTGAGRTTFSPGIGNDRRGPLCGPYGIFVR